MFIERLFILLLVFIFSIVSNEGTAKASFIQKIVDDNDLMNTLKRYNVHTENCDYFSDRLVVIKNIEYYGFDENYHNDGEIIVLDVLAKDIIEIFQELKKEKFPIYNLKITAGKKIVPRWPFGWFGEKVIDDEDTESLCGAYTCRRIQHTDRLSLHSFGVAIDINTLQNPCIFIDEKTNEILNVVPKAGVMYLNRSFNRKGKESKDFGKINSKIVKIFKKHGYDIWGGYWDFPIDYQHFQVSTRKFADLLLLAGKEDAQKIFNLHKLCVNKYNKSLIDLAGEKEYDLLSNYEDNRDTFMKDVFDLCGVKKNKPNKSLNTIKNAKTTI